MVSLGRIARRTASIAAFAALTATALVEGLHATGLTDGAEAIYSDLWHRRAGVRGEPRETALVLVDDASLAARPDEPLVFWGPHFARAIATLRAAGVRLVAVDLIFSVSAERWLDRTGLGGHGAARDFDRPLREQIHSGAVLLAAYATGPGGRVQDFVLPSPEYLLALPGFDLVSHLGIANLETDADGTLRRFRIATGSSAAGLPRYQFAGLAAARARGLSLQGQRFDFGTRSWRGDEAIVARYAGPPGSYRALSFETLLRPDAAGLPEVRALAGKVVVLGGSFAGSNDIHATPYSTGLFAPRTLMSGPELQANLIETLLSGSAPTGLAAPWRIAACVALCALLAAASARRSLWQGLLLLAALLLATAAAGYWLFLHDRLLPVAQLQLGLLATLLLSLLLRLTREERERRRIARMFGRYVSPRVVSELIASPDLPELGGHTREVSVLFMDIRNFTTISERLSAREVVEMLNEFFERACAVLLAEGATIDKFIGDAVMAEFGAPVSQPDHAARALRAAVALRETASRFGTWMDTRFADRGLPAFAVGIGVHSGDAVVGNIGSHSRMEYTAIGDSVNVASRLEGKTKESGCLVLASASTVAAAGCARTGRRLLLEVKGRAQPVEAFEIL